ncbi:hypothetical protein GCM10022419_116460 [Nonomuraea rosea]|uniref:Resolvase/invertase-type recombinase catalytic domain-containing protein n=2 Tax=Nonomuraea rosea TaxID=638574 RepID=A0ABP6ZL48_9ACTN
MVGLPFWISHLVTLGADLRMRGVELHVIEQSIDTGTMEGRAMFGMLSVLAELQRELIVANTMDGLASARARGRVGGRRPRLVVTGLPVPSDCPPCVQTTSGAWSHAPSANVRDACAWV